MKYAINETNFEHTLVILTVSMTTPWSWQDQLQHWIKVLADHVDKLKIDPGKLIGLLWGTKTSCRREPIGATTTGWD